MKRTTLLSLSATLVLGLAAHADTLTLTFAEPNQSASTPGVLSFTGTITAPAYTSSPTSLNADAFNLDQPYVPDGSAFANAPVNLAAGESYTGVLFDIPLTDPLTAGNFNGSFILLGGADASSLDVLVTEAFSITVSPSASSSVTPEPSSVLLFLSGATFLAAAAWRQGRALGATDAPERT